jgi:hypothetical protein
MSAALQQYVVVTSVYLCVPLLPTHMSGPTSSTGVRVSLDGSHTTTLPLACPVIPPQQHWMCTTSKHTTQLCSDVYRQTLVGVPVPPLNMHKHTCQAPPAALV